MHRFSKSKVVAQLRSKKAEAPLNAAILFFAIMIIFSVVWEYSRGLVITNGLRDSLDRAVISVATDNAFNSYNGFREGSSAAVYLEDSSWESFVDRSDVAAHLMAELGISKIDGNDMIKYRADGSEEYTLKNINVTVKNASSYDPSEPIAFTTTASIKVNLRIIGISFATNTDIEVETYWHPKFI